MANKSVFQSFAHAFEGLSHVIWTQPHVRIQLFIVMLVLLLSYVTKLGMTQLLFILSAICLVLIAELFNTAIEVVVNMITEHYHPLAKIAKDVAAAGVLLASTYAVLVGGAVFLNPERLHALVDSVHLSLPLPPYNSSFIAIIVLLGIGVMFIIVPLLKVRVGHGSILRGGAVSGHAAVSFLLCGAIVIYSHFNPLMSILALVLAILVAQSRVEGKIHTLAEVLWGATAAFILLTLLMLFSGVAK